MNEEEIKLIVTMQLKQINSQLNQLRSDVDKAFRDIGNSREVDHATDNMERSFKDLNRTTSEEIRQMYKTVRRYLNDMDRDTTKVTREMRYEIQNMLNGLGANGGRINLNGLSNALRNALRNANLGDALGQSLGNSGAGMTNFIRNIGGLGSLAQILGMNEMIQFVNKMNSGMSKTNQDIAKMATQTKDIVMNLPKGTELVEPIKALNISMVNIEKILAMLIKQFGVLLQMLQKISAIQMGNGLQNYGKYVSTVITQTGKLRDNLKDVNMATKAVKEAQASGDSGKMAIAGKELYSSMQAAINQMTIAQNTLNNLKQMAAMGIFKDIDTGSLGMVSDQLRVVFEELQRVINASKGMDTMVDANIDLSQIHDAETILNTFSTKYDDIKKTLEDGTNFQFAPDFTDIDQMLNEIDNDYLKLIQKLNEHEIKPEVDTEGAKREINTLKDLFNVFGGKELFHQIDTDNIDFDSLTQEAQEVKAMLDELNAKYNINVDYSSLNGVREALDRIKLASEAAANARQHLNELDQSGNGTTQEAIDWTSRLTNAQEVLIRACRDASQQFGQYRMVDWSMFTRDARNAVQSTANDIRNRLTEAFRGFTGTAGSLLYRVGAYFTIPPERMDQIIAQIREKFSSFWDSVKSKGREALDSIAQSDIAQKIKPYMDKAVSVVKAAAEKMKAALDKVWGSRFGAFINNNLSLMTRGFKAVGSKVKELGKKFKDGMKKIGDHTKKAADKVKSSTDKMGSSIKGLISRFLGLYAIIGALKTLFNFGKEAMMLEGQLQNLYVTLGAFKDANGDIKYYGDYFQEWARTTAKAFGIGEASAIKYGNTFAMLLSQTIPKDNLLTATTDLLQQASLIASKTGREVSDVMERIRSGLLGGTEAIEDLGIYVRENTLKGLLNDSGFKDMYGEQLQKAIGMTTEQAHKAYSNLSDDIKNTIRYYGVMYQSIRRFGQATPEAFNTTTGVLLKFQAEVENTRLALG